MDNEKEISFGAFDSELMHQEIYIPEGFTATIEGDKIILTRIESEDEKIRKALIEYFNEQCDMSDWNGVYGYQVVAWLEKQGTYTKKDVDDAFVEGMALAKDELEKQGKQPKEATYTHEVETGNGNIKALVTEKVQLPKFKVGNWYQCIKDFFGKGVTFDKNTAYYCAKEGCLQNEYGCHIAIVKDLYDNFKLWTIQDAKAGDIIAADPIDTHPSPFVAIYKKQNEEDFDSYCFVGYDGNFYKADNGHSTEDIHPATKEQRDFLFQKMKEEGYTFDFEKKELKKIEDEEYNGEDYGIDSLYHAQRILEKTLGSVDGYQTDDGILSHKCAITAIKKLYEQKLADWSEEDERIYKVIVELLNSWAKGTIGGCIIPPNTDRYINWLKFIKYRVYPKQEWKQENTDDLTDFENAMMHIGESFFGKNAGLDPNDTNVIKKQANTLLGLVPSKEWNEEDERILKGIIGFISHSQHYGVSNTEMLTWLKFLKERYTWKPSEEQMEAIRIAAEVGTANDSWAMGILRDMYNDLKKEYGNEGGNT